MIVKHHEKLDEFETRVIQFLMVREAECCVQLGLIESLRRRLPDAIEPGQLATPILWTVEDDGQLGAVAMQTTDSGMLVSQGSEQAMVAIANELVAVNWFPAHLNGVVPSIRTLITAYSEKTGCSARLRWALRCFELREVIPPTAAAGVMRQCVEADRALLERWIGEFSVAIGSIETPERHRVMANRLLHEGRAFFWVDSEPVAMSIWTGQTPNGRRITLVYTPPARRGRGYASNLVAELSSLILASVSKFCFLHTDLANPTSNSIYQKIGYRPVADSEDWAVPLVVKRRERSG